MTLVNTPKGEQNSLASCSPFTDLIKSINIYNHIYRWLIYVSCMVYSTTVLQGKFRAIVDEAFSVKPSVLLVPDSSWEVIHRLDPIPAAADKQMYLQQGVEGYFEVWRLRAGHVASCVDRWLPVSNGFQVYFNKETDDISSARRYINVVNSMS